MTVRVVAKRYLKRRIYSNKRMLSRHSCTFSGNSFLFVQACLLQLHVACALQPPQRELDSFVDALLERLGLCLVLGVRGGTTCPNFSRAAPGCRRRIRGDCRALSAMQRRNKMKPYDMKVMKNSEFIEHIELEAN